MKKIQLSVPNLSGKEWDYVKSCLDENFVSTAGRFVGELEETFAKKVGAKHAIAVVNGTAALHIALLLSDVERSDEVLVPNLTFVAPVNAVKYLGANPVLIDSSWDNLSMCPEILKKFLEDNYSLENGKCVNLKTKAIVKAIIPMHTLGCLADIQKIVNISKKYNIKVIEDASESLGAKNEKGIQSGTFGDFGCYSFNGNKIITSGGGGMIVTNNSEFARKAKHLTTTAKDNSSLHFFHTDVGYNYRMVNVLAALGLAQLERLDEFLTIKRRNALLYKERLSSLKNAYFYIPKKEKECNYWFYSLVLNQDLAECRDLLLEKLIECGIEVRPIWTLMEELPMFNSCENSTLVNSREMRRKIINIPCSTNLTSKEVEFVCSKIVEIIG